MMRDNAKDFVQDAFRLRYNADMLMKAAEIYAILELAEALVELGQYINQGLKYVG